MKNNLQPQEDFTADKLHMLDTQKISISFTESGYLTVMYDGKSYNEVCLIRLIPFHEREKYISVSYQDEEKQWHEIGVIGDIAELPESERAVAEKYLHFRYYIPEITLIHSITDNRLGYLFIEAETTAGRKRISVNDWWTNFKLRDDGTLNVVDADGNRYYIPSIHRLDKKSLKKIQLFV